MIHLRNIRRQEAAVKQLNVIGKESKFVFKDHLLIKTKEEML